ncbi:MAG: TonB-dependent receptor [Cytophagales bacterium]|nr:TonB-dependent receptor [Bernardetiaceae bacterium]MDW8210838.1 TonB-dependent receptor [Cytophagales bacterium]
MKTQRLLAMLMLLALLFWQAPLLAGMDLLSKNVSLSLHGAEVKLVLAELEKIAGVHFIYSPKVIHADRKVDVEIKNEPLSEALNKLLLPLGISYTIRGNQIILRKASWEEWITDNPIKGKVTNSAGEGMPGVSIVIKGTSKGTVTDTEGNFSINAEKGQTLVFSFVGYKTQEITLGEETTLNIVLEDISLQLGEVAIVGSRANIARTDVERPAPIDVLSFKDLQTTGQVEVGQMLQFTSPSFNSAKYGINGIANYADPATLRGLSPDQVLVLIEGKRRHQFSALNLNITVGKGTVVTDMNTIPPLALDRIEILRDGAAAQYGSDAIAGIVNVGLNKSVNKLKALTQFGITTKGDGATYTAGVNYGFKLGKDKSYLNLTLHYHHADGTDRSDPFNGNIYSTNREVERATRIARGVWPADGEFRVSKYGSNQTTSYQAFANLGYPLNNRWMIYGFGGYSHKYIKAYGFFRNAIPTNPNSNTDIWPDGYSPVLPGTTLDYSAVAGIRRQAFDQWNFDFSVGYGYNSLDLEAKNTANPSMGAESPRDFYVGKSAFGQFTSEINLSKNYIGLLGTKTFNVAMGSQFRIDRFQLVRGDENSYKIGPLAYTRGKLPGSSGRPGIAPEDETDTRRSNIGIYLDIESDITNKFLVAGALRYENYSDFGSNLSGKIASRLKLTESFAVRGSINRGFRAPSLQQIYNSVTTSTVQAGEIRQTKQLRSDEPRLRRLGISDPKAETSWNYNLGMTANLKDKLLFTLDAYQIDIQDRIIITENLVVNNIPALRALFPNFQEVAFFTNQIDTRTQGVDLVTTYKHSFNDRKSLTASLALTMNRTKISRIKPTPAELQAGSTRPVVLLDTISIALIETSQPREKVLGSVAYQWNKLTATVRINYFGPVTAWEKPANQPHRSQTFSGKTLTDVVLSYNLTKNITISAGGNNIFDVYPDRVFSNYASYFNGQTPFTRNANQFGFNGAYYYLNAVFNF